MLKEGFTEDFLACHFTRVSGEVYEPGAGHDVDEDLRRNSVLGPPGDHAALDRLAAAVKEPDPNRRWPRLQAALDTDRFVTFMAMEILLGHRDGYCLARNNFRVYHDLDTDKVLFFPHGMDQLLGTADLPWQPSLAGLVAQAVMATPEGRQLYATTFNSLFTNVFSAPQLTRRVDQLVAELQPALSPSEFDQIRTEAAQIKQRIARRQLCLQSQLARPDAPRIDSQSGTVTLDGWLPVETPARGALDRVDRSGRPALHIAADAEGLGSWRTKSPVAPGHYRFAGRVCVAGVQPLHGSVSGARLRVGGRAGPWTSLTTDSDWHALTAEFAVEHTGEDVEFICEFRARKGEAWFELGSLQVVPLTTYEKN